MRSIMIFAVAVLAVLLTGLALPSFAEAQQHEISAVEMARLRENAPDESLVPLTETVRFSAEEHPQGVAVVLVRFDWTAFQAIDRRIVDAELHFSVSSTSDTEPGHWVVLWDSGHTGDPIWNVNSTWNTWEGPLGDPGLEFGRVQQGANTENLGQHMITGPDLVEQLNRWRDAGEDWTVMARGIMVRYENLEGHDSQLGISSHWYSLEAWRPVILVWTESEGSSGGCGVARGASSLPYAGFALLILLCLARSTNRSKIGGGRPQPVHTPHIPPAPRGIATLH